MVKSMPNPKPSPHRPAPRKWAVIDHQDLVNSTRCRATPIASEAVDATRPSADTRSQDGRTASSKLAIRAPDGSAAAPPVTPGEYRTPDNRGAVGVGSAELDAIPAVREEYVRGREPEADVDRRRNQDEGDEV